MISIRLLVALVMFGLVGFTTQLSTVRAEFVSTTDAVANTVSTGAALQPPTDLRLQMIPLVGICTAQLDWVASPDAGTTSYEIVRLVASTEAVAAGPFTVDASTTSFDDIGILLQPPVVDFTWRVRAIGAAFPSPWTEFTQSPADRCSL